jgi:hypothetical protein
VLTPYDDYPIHQTARPVAHPSSGDRNVYDRYFFNGYAVDGSIFFAAALGLYPNRDIIDAAFSVVLDGNQRSVHASGRAPADRSRTSVGPIEVAVLEPLRHLQVDVADADLGVTASLRFDARTPAVEEPPFRLDQGGKTVFDYTRLAQWGSWSGWIDVDGVRTTIEPGAHLGCRDRSWGVRPVGEPPGGAPAHELPQFFWLWGPLHFDDCCTHFDVNELSDGRRWHQTGVIVPLLDDASAPYDAAGVEWMSDVGYTIDWLPGTRRAERATISLTPALGAPHVIELEPILTFPMRGLGYLSPDWNHGSWKGELVVGEEAWRVADLDPLEPWNVHVQQLVRARWGERVGVGVLEQLAINRHHPTGLQGLLDGAGAPSST